MRNTVGGEVGPPLLDALDALEVLDAPEEVLAVLELEPLDVLEAPEVVAPPAPAAPLVLVPVLALLVCARPPVPVCPLVSAPFEPPHAAKRATPASIAAPDVEPRVVVFMARTLDDSSRRTWCFRLSVG
jgi:hypothetical protein